MEQAINMDIYDIVIIGAGPSGSTLARYLDTGYKVLLIDKKSEKENHLHEKCCGGLLAPDAQKMLAELDLGVPKSVLEDPQIFAVKTIDICNRLTRYYQRYYINVNRARFDRWLLSLVSDKVTVFYDTLYKTHVRYGEIIHVSFIRNKEEFTVKTKILVGADGAMSKVRKNSFQTPFPDQYVSIQKWYQTNNEMPYFISVFDKDITDFYSWVIKKGSTLLVGGAFREKDNANEKFNLLIEKLKKEGYDLTIELKKEGTLINRTRKLCQIALVNQKVVLIGEAAGLISPSSAEGISYALKSGYCLAKAINENIDFERKYKKSMVTFKMNIFIKNLKIPFMYHHLLRKLVMLSKISSIK